MCVFFCECGVCVCVSVKYFGVCVCDFFVCVCVSLWESVCCVCDCGVFLGCVECFWGVCDISVCLSVNL